MDGEAAHDIEIANILIPGPDGTSMRARTSARSARLSPVASTPVRSAVPRKYAAVCALTSARSIARSNAAALPPRGSHAWVGGHPEATGSAEVTLAPNAAFFVACWRTTPAK